MADLCHHCALDIFGEDIGDLAGLSTPADTEAGLFPVPLCEGCGPTHVDHTGRRVDEPDAAPTRSPPANAPAYAATS